MSRAKPPERLTGLSYDVTSISGLSDILDPKKLVPTIIVFGAWELGPALGLIEPLFLPPFHEVMIVLWEITVSYEIFPIIMTSLERGFKGYILASVVAIPIGVIMGWKRIIYEYTEIIIEVLRPMPAVALIPIFILFFGPSETSILAVIFYPLFFIQLIATIYGTQNINETLIESMQVLGMSERRLFREVFLPGSLPGIFTGLRQNTAIMLIMVIVAELVLASDGIGNFVIVAQRQFQIAEMYAGILVIGIIGYVLNKGFILLQNRILFWSEREGAM